MSVTSQLTQITAAESADSANWDDLGGGPGSTQSTDNPYQGSDDRARRIDNNVRGFSYDTTTGQDISGTGVHVLFLTWVIQPQLIGTGGIEFNFGDAATPQSGNWDGHTFAASDYPITSSWLCVAVDPTRTRDTGSGTLSLSSVRQFGAEFDMGDISGTSENCHLDRIAYGTVGYQQTGTSVGFAEFRTFESSNRHGVIFTVNGIDFVNARLQWGTSGTAITGDQTLSIVFTPQPLAAADFTGLTVDLQNASTDLTLRGFARSGDPSVSRGDLQVVGTSGALNLVGSFTDLREIVLTSAVTADSGATLGAVSITQSTATLSGITVITEAATSVATITAPSFGDIDDVAFVQGGAGHALEIASAGTYTFDNLRFSGYGANTTDSAAIDVTAASGTVTINVINGGDTPTYKTAGATVVINNTVSVSVEAVESTNAATKIQGARVVLYETPISVTSITRSVSTATVTTSTAHGFTTGDEVMIRGANEGEYNGVWTITVTGSTTFTYTVSGSPSSPATTVDGIETAFMVIDRVLTNASGIAQNTGYNYGGNQAVEGFVRKSTASPTYKTQPVSGTITSAGLSITAPMVRD